MTREPDPSRLLLAALRRSAAAAGCTPVLVHEAQVPWASATFVGGQHRVRAGGAGMAGWLETLPQAELALRGYIVADLVVQPEEGGAALLVLLLEE